MKICVNVPSIRPEYYNEMIESAEEHLGKVFDYMFFHLVAQDPWSKSSIGKAHAVDLAERYEYASMLDLRMCSVNRFLGMPDYYMFIDDDILFKPGAEEYFMLVMEQLMIEAPSVYQLFGSRYTGVPQLNPEECIMTTNRGLIIRSTPLAKFSKDYQPLIGGGEDAVLGYIGLEHNENRIIRGDAPIDRRDVKHFEKNSKSAIHDTEFFDTGCGKFIRERYDDPSWELLSGKLPKGLQR